MDSLRDVLDRGPAFGSWIMLDSVLSAEYLGRAENDFLVLDSQHGETASAAQLGLLQAAGSRGTPVLARVIAPEPHLIMRALDLGAQGVILPMINTAAQARTAALACRYAPRGTRSYGPIRPGAPTVENANNDVLCIPMIETLESLENLAEIIATPGVDALFIGPYDLGLVLGISPAQVPENETLAAVIRKITSVARDHGIPVGSVAANETHARHLLDLGVSFLSLGSDLTFVREGFANRRLMAGRLRSAMELAATQGRS